MKKYIYLLLTWFISSSLLAQAQSGASGWTAKNINSTKSFIENKSQFNGKDQRADSKILFGAQEGDVKIYFTNNGLTYRFGEIRHQKQDKSTAESSEREREENATKMISHFVKLQWLNANASA